MNLALSNDSFSLVVEHLERAHRELMKKAEKWSFDLEGDFDNYMQVRREEINLAYVINSIKKQRTIDEIRQAHPNDEPLADWEKELLSGKLE